jgi:hypothetical protein
MSIVHPAATVDVERVLAQLEEMKEDERVAFMCILAHSLTVDIRAALLDRPVSEAAADRAYRVNEFLHQLTSCVNPRQRRSAQEDAALIRAIVESAGIYGLEAAIRRGLATAAGNASSGKKSVAPA